MKVQFVVLEHCPEITAAAGRKIAVVIRRAESEQDLNLEVYTARDWSKDVDPEDAVYIKEMLDDLKSQPLDESDAVFLSMTQMSAGVLRTGDQGLCDDGDLAMATGVDLEA